MQLGFDLTFQQLLTRDGLHHVDARFVAFLKACHAQSYRALLDFRRDTRAFDDQAYDALIMLLVPQISAFISELFMVSVDSSYDGHDLDEQILSFRAIYLESRSQDKTDLSSETWQSLTLWLEERLATKCAQMTQQQLVAFGLALDAQNDQIAMDKLRRWCRGVTHQSGNGSISKWPVFWQPKKNGVLRVDVIPNALQTRYQSASHDMTARDDFSLIPSYWDADRVMLHTDYCRFCHDRSVDYCRTGFYQKKGEPSKGFRKDESGTLLSGCPLDEKISQMHWFKRKHQHLSALVTVMIDNPFCAITGHRICNDCMQSCIFQKQDPVDTPQVESRVVMDVLSMRWGVEIYDLLMKWHPLRREESSPAQLNHRHVLVMGLGPSGFSMLHHLWMRGCAVTGMDGAHLAQWPYGDVNKPVEHFSSIQENLSTRLPLGFGGVCEYGITVRWDKNLLNVIYLSLLRRMDCHMLGNCRFGGTLTVDDAWRIGYDHLVLALGAGLPKAIDVPNSLARGMYQASDFLMSLHTTGTHRKTQMGQQSMQLPCVVIGAGLTAVDAATEAQAYYLQMVQMVHLRLDRVIQAVGEVRARSAFSDAEFEQLSLWSSHGAQVIDVKRTAQRRDTLPCFQPLLDAWGGVHIVYRGRLESSPAYRTNPQELQSALDSGVIFHAQTAVIGVDVDHDGSVSDLVCTQPWSGETISGFNCTISDLRYVDQKLRARLDVGHLAPGMVISMLSEDSQSSSTNDVWMVDLVDKDCVEFRPVFPRAYGSHEALVSCTQVRLSLPRQLLRLPARHILVATGSAPNTAFEYEHRGHFERSGSFYRRYALADDGLSLLPLTAQNSQAHAFLSSYQHQQGRVSLIGDLHPEYHGSVVKALASSRAAVSEIMRHVQARTVPALSSLSKPIATALEAFTTRVFDVRQLPNQMVFMVLHAPWLSRRVSPGVLFRLQPYLNLTDPVHRQAGTDSLCLQPVDYDVDSATISFLFKKENAVATCLSRATKGQLVGCMGPTGVALSTKPIPKRVLLIADASRIASASLYYRHYQHVAAGVDFYVESTDQARDLVEILELSEVKWIHSCDMPLQSSIDVVLQDYETVVLHGDATFVRSYYHQFNHAMQQMDGLVRENMPAMIGYVGGSMQCGLKGICAKCLQWQIDPRTGDRTKAVYACSWQDQPLALVDLDHLQRRTDDQGGLLQLDQLWSSIGQADYEVESA